MSIDGTRKPTKGWEISSSGKMVNITAGDGIVVDQAVPIAESAATPITDSDVVNTEPPVPKAPERGRRSTLDFFNEEMAVLDRPLEGEVEYIDEAPSPSRWRRVGMFAVVVAVIGAGGGVVLSRRHTSVAPRAQASQPATSPGADAPTVIAATATTAAPAAAVPAPAAAEGDDPATEEDATAAAPSHAARNKVKAKSGHGKHSRSTSGKGSRHQSSKRSVSSKHSSSRHH